jgi:hypothetical protein
MKTVRSFVMMMMIVGPAGSRAWADAPAGQYTVQIAAGTVKDNKSLLTWQQGHSEVQKNWNDAVTYCTGLILGGVSGWRLPTKFELESLVDVKVASPMVDVKAFPDTPDGDWFWSSTPFVGLSGNAWAIHYGFGGTNYTDMRSSFLVRCVHS